MFKLKLFCDNCGRFVWPKSAKMTVTRYDTGKEYFYHFQCWLLVASEEEIWEFRIKAAEWKEKHNAR